MRVGFEDEIEALERLIEGQGDLVLRAVRRSLEALGSDDYALAGAVIAGDDEVDERFSEVERRVLELLARQAPVATDLRFVLAALHVNLSLERIADYAETIAKLTRLVSGEQRDDSVLERLEVMGLRAEQMIRVALDSFVARDAERARTLDELDQVVDNGNREVSRMVVDVAGEPGTRSWALQMLIVARSLERMADHAVDIAEQTGFLATGAYRSHRAV